MRRATYHRIKNTISRVTALILIVITLPILIILAVWLAISLHGNPIFSQRRTGYQGRLFTLYKFRTMQNTTDTYGNLLPDHERITRLGQILRKYSLDELPQLFNILFGNMAFIGPRPLLKEYLPLYTTRQRGRHKVLPGISGWAQVNGRNAISWNAKFELDVYYVEHESITLDLKVIVATISTVVSGSDVNASSATTMEPFNGNN